MTHTAKHPPIDVAAFRREHELTLRQLADDLGVDTSTVWRWEHYGLPKRGLALKVLKMYVEQMQ
jgi:DNA-binding transcriptional regulator YiaG